MKETTPEARKGVDLIGQEAKELWQFLLEKGEKNLRNTGFVKTDKKIDRQDIQSLRHYYQDVFTYEESKFGKESAVFNESLHEHLELSARYAVAFAKRLNLDPIELEALALMHDSGRLISHRRGRNDRIGNRLMDRLQIKQSFRDQLPSDTVYSSVVTNEETMLAEKLTQKEGGIPAVLTLVDILAKYKNSADPSQGLRTWQDAITQSQARQNLPDKKGMWPSEYQRQVVITSDKGMQGIETKYEALRQWFEIKAGCPISAVIADVESSLKETPLPTRWSQKESLISKVRSLLPVWGQK